MSLHYFVTSANEDILPGAKFTLRASLAMS